MVERCYYNELCWCKYTEAAERTRTYILAVVITQDGKCAMMKTPIERKEEV